MSQFLRAYCDQRQAAKAEPGEPIRFVISTEGVKRDGKDLKADQWTFENYRKNPVVLWAHDYFGGNLPIGRGSPGQDGAVTFADVVFDQEDELARQIESKYRRGFLNAVSVGWKDLPVEGEVMADLIDISAVPVPGDPDALIERQIRALKPYIEEQNENRAAIPPHSTAKADEGHAWDGPAQVSAAEGAAQLRRIHAWVDGEMDPETKQAYKLPHHLTDSGQVVWRGVAAAMARLLQAGTQIPDGDRRGVYNHLSRHYGQFDREPPEFRSSEALQAFGPDEVRGQFLEGEWEILQSLASEGDWDDLNELVYLNLINLRLKLEK